MEYEIMRQNLNRILVGLSLDANCVAVQQNRHTAIYDIRLNPGCKVRKIESSAPEIALGLRSKTEPILRSIPQMGIVRLHVANKNADILKFDDIYNEQECPDNLLPILLGETDEGNKLWTDFSKNPHTIIAGSTGSGKSVFLHLLIENIKRLNNLGHDIDLWLSDPKRVEFNKYKDDKVEYNISSIVDTYDDTISMLKDLEGVMEDTYTRLYDMKLNSAQLGPKHLKKRVVIIDECADLMMQDKKSKKFESSLCSIASKCRAANIYICIATQRPSADILSGIIKANFPARIAFKTSSKTDSRVILDANGAESLLGNGDGLIYNYDNNFTRFQAAMV